MAMASADKILVICILTVLIRQSKQITCAKCSGAYSTLACEKKDCYESSCYMTVHPSPLHHGVVYTGGCGSRQCYNAARRRFLTFLNTGVHQTKCCSSGNLCNVHLTFDENPTTIATNKPVQLTTKTAKTTPTTTTTSTKAPTPPSLILPKGIECQVCSGPTCGLYEDGPTMTCPDDFPYCLNTVNNDSEGNKFVTKRCARYEECKTRVQQPGCRTFDPAQIYTKIMECKYCCQTSFCNRMVVPQRETIVQ